MSDQTEPSTLIAMADKRFMGRPGDNATEAALRACAQQWAFERQESDLRRIRAELAERRLATAQAREEALEQYIRIRRQVEHGMLAHPGRSEDCEVGPCGPAGEALRAKAPVGAASEPPREEGT